MSLLFTYHRYTPDVVFLQELIPPYVQYLKKRAVSYLFIEGLSFDFFDRKHALALCLTCAFNLCRAGGDEGYFTGMMLKKTRVKLLESELVTFPSTQMMRNLLVAQVCAVGTHSLARVYCSSTECG